MKKWNYEKHAYEPYDGPKGAMLYNDDMNAVCRCAQCGAKMKFGEGYTSSEIHNDAGFGYCVCGDCRSEEIGREFRAARKEEP